MTRKMKFMAAMAEKYGIEVLDELEKFERMVLKQANKSPDERETVTLIKGIPQETLQDVLFKVSKKNQYQQAMEVVRWAKNTRKWVKFSDLDTDIFNAVWAQLEREKTCELSEDWQEFRFESGWM